MIAGLQFEIGAHMEDFTTARDLHRRFGVKPQCRLDSVTVLAARRCRAVLNFGVVWVSSIATFAIVRRPRGRNSDFLQNGSPAPLIEFSETISFDSLHFVALKQDSSVRDDFTDDDIITGHPSNYVLQSVLNMKQPLSLQCYPSLMLDFAVSISAMMNSDIVNGKEHRVESELAVPWHHFPESPVLILGMGCNVIGRALDVLFGEGAPIHVLEIEPTVVELCREQGALASSRPGGFQCHVGDVRTSLGSMPRNCSLIFLDCYDPLASSMMHAQELIASCRDHLRDDGGVLVVNAHVGIEFDSLLPFSLAFPGPEAVHVAQMPGIDQVIVACRRSSMEQHPPTPSLRLLKAVSDELERAQMKSGQGVCDVAVARRKRSLCQASSIANFQINKTRFKSSTSTRIRRKKAPEAMVCDLPSEFTVRLWATCPN